jgi:hypothetical protein
MVNERSRGLGASGLGVVSVMVALAGCAASNTGGSGEDGDQTVVPPQTSTPLTPGAGNTPPPTTPSVTAGSGGSGAGCAQGDACAPMPPVAPVAGAGGMDGAAGAPMVMAPPDGSLDPNVPTCFDFKNHGQPVAGDTSKYGVIPGEHYVCNHFKSPWNEPAELVSWQTLYDNQAIVHHWLAYSVPTGGAVDGQFEACIGTHLLQDAQLVAGWAVGSNDVDMPPDVALRMPGADREFLIEWHYFNSTGVEQMDASGVRLCVLPQGTRTNLAGITWLGTEFFNGPAGMPAGQMSEFSGTCQNVSGAPINIVRFWPHMHQWGRNMKSTVVRATGATENVFEMPFDFNYQISYEATVVLQPGDAITSTCTFDNQSAAPVAFGPSSDQEMCYQFAFSWPAGALDNGVLSLVGATNTCW